VPGLRHAHKSLSRIVGWLLSLSAAMARARLVGDFLSVRHGGDGSGKLVGISAPDNQQHALMLALGGSQR
jgi:hypothetical protein